MKFKDARVGMRVRYNLKKASYKGIITKVSQEKSQSTLKTARGSIVTSVYTNHIFVKPDKRKKEIDCAPRDIKEVFLPKCIYERLEIGRNDQVEALRIYGHMLSQLFKKKVS